MLLGHQKQWQFLKKAAEIGKISHSFLFFGEEKVGKKTLAFEFVKLLNCKLPDYSKRPCQVCSSCESIQKRKHPDLYLVEPLNGENRKTEILISQIRELSQKLSLRSFSALFKMAIIDQAHCLTKEAQSCFLKTLEEPKGKTILILITEYPDLLLTTILSRVQKLKFTPIKRKEIEDYFKNQGYPEEKAKFLAFLSSGRPGVALEFLSHPEKLKKEKQKITEFLQVISPDSNLALRFQFVKNLVSQKEDLKETLNIWLKYFRNIFFKKVGAGSYDLDYPFVNKFSLTKIKNTLSLLEKISFLVSKTNVNPKLALEILMINL